jgi:hypothetical protein
MGRLGGGVVEPIATCSRKPDFLRLATLGTLRIDPDHPEIAARALCSLFALF